jgi:hypothetical protein
MGILPGSSQPKTSAAAKRKSGAIDFSAIKPLKETSAVKNMSGYRDAKVDKDSLRKLDFKTNDDEMDSDADDDDAEEAMVKDDDKDDINPNRTLTAEDADRQERLAEGVKKINLVCLSPFIQCLLNARPAQAAGFLRTARAPVSQQPDQALPLADSHGRR